MLATRGGTPLPGSRLGFLHALNTVNEEDRGHEVKRFYSINLPVEKCHVIATDNGSLGLKQSL